MDSSVSLLEENLYKVDSDEPTILLSDETKLTLRSRSKNPLPIYHKKIFFLLQLLKFSEIFVLCMWAQRHQMFPVQRSYIHVSRCDRTRDEFISCTKLDAWLHLLSPLCPRQALATVKLSLCLRNTAMHCFNFWKFSEIFADAVWSEVSHVTS